MPRWDKEVEALVRQFWLGKIRMNYQGPWFVSNGSKLVNLTGYQVRNCWDQNHAGLIWVLSSGAENNGHFS